MDLINEPKLKHAYERVLELRSQQEALSVLEKEQRAIIQQEMERLDIEEFETPNHLVFFSYRKNSLDEEVLRDKFPDMYLSSLTSVFDRAEMIKHYGESLALQVIKECSKKEGKYVSFKEHRHRRKYPRKRRR